MCRFVLYMGPPITLDLLTTRPAHSIIHQSFKSRLREEPLNGDGFGIAWYVPEISLNPAQYRSIQPAWNNVNLLHLARVSRSPVILAHIRAASEGIGISESNCHPFAVDRFAFMHNGSLADFPRLKRRIAQRLSDESYAAIHGTTDSEYLFALFRDHMAGQTASDETEAMADALQATIVEAVELTVAAGVTRDSLFNLAVSDGRRAVVSRYATGDAPSPSLYLRTGQQYVCENAVCQMIDVEGDPSTVMVASEPLTDEPGWNAVPPNHLLLIHPDFSISTRALD